MDFKIIAISPLDRCSKKFLRILRTGKDYLLYNNYEILPNRIIEHDSNIPEFLYGSEMGIRINISAIVGKNGTGKSTIIELLYAAIFNTAKVCGILPERDDEDKKI